MKVYEKNLEKKLRDKIVKMKRLRDKIVKIDEKQSRFQCGKSTVNEKQR